MSNRETDKPRGLRQRVVGHYHRLRLLTLRKNKHTIGKHIVVQFLPEKFATDLRSLGPTHVCTCGCNVFKSLVSFENYEISWWYLEGECLNCGNKVALPCPLDNPTNI